MAYTDPQAQQIQALYAKYGRTASDAEIDANRGNPGGMAAIDQLLQNDQQSATGGQQMQPAPQPGDPGFDPNVNNSSTQWDPGASAPNSQYPGWQWDSTQGRYMQSNTGGLTGTSTDGSSSGGDSGSLNYGFSSSGQSPAPPGGGPGMLDPWTQQFSGRTPTPLPAAPTYGPAPTLGAPSSGAFSNAAFNAPTPFSYGDYSKPADFNYAAYQAPDKFVAPTDVTEQNDPGYQFRLKQGQNALINSASAQGLGRSGGTLKDFIDYNQNSASQEYGNVYNRSLGEYQMGAQQGLTSYNTNRANAADIYNTNANLGLTAYNTNRNNAFQNYTTNFGNALSAYNTNTANAANVYNTNWGAQKDVYNAAMQGWQGTNALNQSTWQTQYQGAANQNQVNWNQDWQQYLQQYDAFKRNQEWPYQVLNQQSQPVG
jgi:hypothetical protein